MVHVLWGPSPHTPGRRGSAPRTPRPQVGIPLRVADWTLYQVFAKEAPNVKKLLVLAVAAGGVFFVLRRKSAAKAEADLWREATAPAGDK